MRIYQNLFETVHETERNLWEMGIEVPLKTMQNKVVEGDPDLGLTKELMGITFQVIDPYNHDEVQKAYAHVLKDPEKIKKYTSWVAAEFLERVSRETINPGHAWKIRAEDWEQFLVDAADPEDPMMFEYTYNERYNFVDQLPRLIEYLKKDLNSRRAVLSMWDVDLDLWGLEQKRRVPCSVTYSWLYRNGKLNIFYHMRSSDFYTHFVNDMVLTSLLNAYVAKQIGVEPGMLTVYINSLHAYYKDLKERKIF